MKKLILLVVSLSLSFGAILWAQDSDKAMSEALNKVSQAIKEGNASGVGAYFGSSVSLDISGSESMYSKDQAVQVLKSFFSANRPKSFTTPYKSGQNIKYAVGTLQTQGGGSFRVSIFVKQEDGKAQVQRIIIEKE